MTPELFPEIRDELRPSRLTIAMWCFSWLHCHHPGGSFEDYEKCTDDLLLRGFNCIRIEGFPWVIGRQSSLDEVTTFPADPYANWGQSPSPFPHKVARELLELLGICKKKGIKVILATWGFGCDEYPAVLKLDPSEAMGLRLEVWEKTLQMILDHDLQDTLAYVDLDQEFPHFSPIKSIFKSAADKGKEDPADTPEEAMLEAGINFDRDTFNDRQRLLLKGYMVEGLEFFQYRFPSLRFTYSFTNFTTDLRKLGDVGMDVLELHFWIHGRKFDNRTGFPGLEKDRRPDRQYADYQRRVYETLEAVGPMLRREREAKLAFGDSWSREISAPMVTTEAWGPWWHMDHPDLKWDWLKEWCADGMERAAEWKLWGTTPWNYAHPYWENWTRDVEWYQSVNRKFLES
jgi:hypothetical protein